MAPHGTREFEKRVKQKKRKKCVHIAYHRVWSEKWRHCTTVQRVRNSRSFPGRAQQLVQITVGIFNCLTFQSDDISRAYLFRCICAHWASFPLLLTQPQKTITKIEIKNRYCDISPRWHTWNVKCGISSFFYHHIFFPLIVTSFFLVLWRSTAVRSQFLILGPLDGLRWWRWQRKDSTTEKNGQLNGKSLIFPLLFALCRFGRPSYPFVVTAAVC